MSPNSKCVFQSYERKGSQQTTQHRGKLGTLENNQKCPPDFMVFWTSTDLPMKLTVTGLLLLLNKIWRLWTWRQDGRAFYAETNDCSKIIYAVKKAMLLVSEKKIRRLAVRLWDLIWNKSRRKEFQLHFWTTLLNPSPGEGGVLSSQESWHPLQQGSCTANKRFCAVTVRI